VRREAELCAVEVGVSTVKCKFGVYIIEHVQPRLSVGGELVTVSRYRLAW
jgi:hypothetical protein